MLGITPGAAGGVAAGVLVLKLAEDFLDGDLGSDGQGVNARIGWHFCFGNAWGNDILSASYPQGYQTVLPHLFGAWIPAWGILTQPLAFILFLTAGIAATKRIPFDTPEGESEIIGYFVEYSGMKFGMFAMADFLETVVIAGMTTALFLGGWQVPYLQAAGFVFPWGATVELPHLAVVALQVIAFLTKVVVMIWFLMLIRWTLPRFRYDQAMRLGWLALFPLSVLNILITAVVLLTVGKA